jgi:hypothetical protein
VGSQSFRGIKGIEWSSWIPDQKVRDDCCAPALAARALFMALAAQRMVAIWVEMASSGAYPAQQSESGMLAITFMTAVHSASHSAAKRGGMRDADRKLLA